MRVLLPRLALVLCVVGAGMLSVGCGSGSGVDLGRGPCTASVDPAVTITVFDARTGLPAATGATATLTDGAFTETMRPYTSDGNGTLTGLQGADERAGTYTVRVTKPGYTAFVQNRVVVTRNECHVNTVRLRADLVPLP